MSSVSHSLDQLYYHCINVLSNLIFMANFRTGWRVGWLDKHGGYCRWHHRYSSSREQPRGTDTTALQEEFVYLVQEIVHGFGCNIRRGTVISRAQKTGLSSTDRTKTISLKLSTISASTISYHGQGCGQLFCYPKEHGTWRWLYLVSQKSIINFRLNHSDIQIVRIGFRLGITSRRN